MGAMSSRTRLALGLLGSALFLGLLGDELLRATPVGLNLFLWVATLVAVLLALARWHRAPLTGGRRWMLPVLVIFAGLVVWRDSPWLVSLDVFALVVALALGSLRTPRPVHRAGLADYAVGLGYASAAAGGRTVTLMQRGHRLAGAAEGDAGQAGGRRRSRSHAGRAVAPPLRRTLRGGGLGLPGLRVRRRPRCR